MGTRGCATVMTRTYERFVDDEMMTTRQRIMKFDGFELEERQLTEEWRTVWQMVQTYKELQSDAQRRGDSAVADGDRAKSMARILKEFDDEVWKAIRHLGQEGDHVGPNPCTEEPLNNLTRRWREDHPDWKAQQDDSDRAAVNWGRFRRTEGKNEELWRTLEATNPYQAVQGIPSDEVLPMLSRIWRAEQRRKGKPIIKLDIKVGKGL
jgi:hypothetical protein